MKPLHTDIDNSDDCEEGYAPASDSDSEGGDSVDDAEAADCGHCLGSWSKDSALTWTRVMLCFSVLAIGKGLFGWITVEPDSKGWTGCRARLAPGKYPVEWYAEQRSLWELLMMDPTSRLCADMMYSGHTYFVAIFALGLHENVRKAFRLHNWWVRLGFETLVTLAWIFQQGFEVYFVLKSRFHYSADVVMATFLAYILYTNGMIAAVAKWWTSPSHARIHAFLKEEPDLGVNSQWVEAMQPRATISPGCCCCDGQEYLYSRRQLMQIMHRIGKATSKLDDRDHLKLVKDQKMLVREAAGMLHERSVAPAMCGM
eukprot:TRINITY_DN19210_c0_g2_i2.p1 TRINITY_DN19210_c0_g2~~TRINITY_DN19210_c0_g2_i2.p1  ORF type:complete len:314 (+),score=46.82 TRINITY_DN19210_c0_g2_i2:214-1155(+)